MGKSKTYEHISGNTEGDSTPHVHFIGKVGSTQHKHHHTGEHIHEREAKMQLLVNIFGDEGTDQLQTGYQEGVSTGQ